MCAFSCNIHSTPSMLSHLKYSSWIFPIKYDISLNNWQDMRKIRRKMRNRIPKTKVIESQASVGDIKWISVRYPLQVLIHMRKKGRTEGQFMIMSLIWLGWYQKSAHMHCNVGCAVHEWELTLREPIMWVILM